MKVIIEYESFHPDIESFRAELDLVANRAVSLAPKLACTPAENEVVSATITGWSGDVVGRVTVEK